MSTQELWINDLELDLVPETRQRIQADVCVVGAGIAGLTAAYWLSKAGKNTVIVDPAPVRGGQTRMTTAHLASVIDDRFFEIERIHGEEGTRLAAQSHARAINAIEDIVLAEQIDCDFTRLDGYLILGAAGDGDLLDKELDAARKTGVMKVERLPKAPLSYFDTGPCLRFAHQGRLHPMRYLAGLAGACQRRGTRFVVDRALQISGGSGARVVCEGGAEIRCEAIVVATNSPVNNLFALHTKMAPYRTFAIGIEADRQAMPDMLLWDMEDPYHYIRWATGDGAPVLIVGGEDYKTAHEHDDEARIARLESWARDRFGALGSTKYRWSGQVMETIDGLAFIGRNPADHDNVFVIAGDSGMGMTHGTIGGEIVSDLVLGRESPFAELYSPSRKPLGAIESFLKENLDVAAQYASWATAGEVDSEQEIPAGQGAVIRRGLKKIAAYRDPSGTLHECSAICTHLGCIVGWNPTSESWDCPCHGSRFSPLGEVIQGPATKDLAEVHETAAKA
jgi:glycine/D-amino acid oxidase-like deaminating enzyme/nitrite reductase/ring-hydroxylating ferredoxin subunit